jgi:hypothetical protein
MRWERWTVLRGGAEDDFLGEVGAAAMEQGRDGFGVMMMEEAMVEAREVEEATEEHASMS